jgi:hypothetical protein
LSSPLVGEESSGNGSFFFKKHRGKDFHNRGLEPPFLYRLSPGEREGEEKIGQVRSVEPGWFHPGDLPG